MSPDESPLFSPNRPWERRTFFGKAATNDVEYGIDGRWWSAGFILCAIIVFSVACQFTSESRAEVAGESVISIPALWLTFRKSREKAWFWAFLIFDLAVHALAFLALPLPERHRPSKGDLLFFQIDIVVMGVIAALLKWLGRRSYSRL